MAYIGKRPQDTFPAGNAVTATTIAANAVTASELAINAVDTNAIADGAVTAAKLAANSIAVTNIPDGLLTATQMANSSIGSDQMINGAVTTAKLGADAVTGAKIADDAIDSEHLTDGSIDTAHIGDLQVTSAKIAANTIATGNIADNAVDGTKIAQNSILTRHIDDAQVTADQLADDAVTAAKLASGAVVTASIVDENVTTAKITDANVTTVKLADDSVTLAKMAGLARGKIIVGDSSGNPSALALGSNGQVLKSDGTDLVFGTDEGLTTEAVQDIAGAMFSSNTETGITATYQDADGTIDLVVSGTAATIVSDFTEAVQDTAGGMFSSNTETNVTATYQDSDGTVDLAVEQQLNNTSAPYYHKVVVTVVSDGGNKYALDGGTQAIAKVTPNVVYRFDQSDSSNSGHPFRFGTAANGSEISAGYTIYNKVGTPGSAGAYTEVAFEQDAPGLLYYWCSAHSGMGAQVSISDESALTQTLTNKTLTSPNITGLQLGGSAVNSTAAELNIIDGDTSASSTTLADADRVVVNDAGTMKQVALTDFETYFETALDTLGNVTSVGTLTDLTTSGNVVVGGNLTVNGSTVTNSSTNTTIEDRLIELGTGTTGSPANDMGIVLERGDSANAFIGFDESADKFTVGTGTFTGASTGNLSITTGTLVANIEGNVTGNVTGNLTGTASAIADNSVTSAKIVNGTIVSADIANNAILTQHIDDNQITADQIADTTITASQIANATISTTQIAANTIATGNVADNAIDGTKIAQNSILTRHIDDAQVTADQLASSAVTTAKVADDAITLDKMAGLARGKIIVGDASGNPVALALGSSGQVLKSDGTDLAFAAESGQTTEQIQDIVGAMFSSNTETNITATYQDADGTIDLVVPNELSSVTELGTLTTLTVDDIKINGTQIGHTSDEDAMSIASSGVVTFTQIPVLPDDAITQAKIADDAVGADQLAANSVVSASIVNGSIVSADIAANTIATSNIADNAVDGTKIASNSILTRHIDDNQITGDQIADDIVLSGTGAITVPDGTTGQRPGSAAAGMFRYNTTTGGFEGYTTEWGAIAGGGGGNGFLTDIFDGTTTPATDGSRTAFTMSQAVSDEKFVMVFIDGVYQAHAAYSVSGTTLTMADAPVAGRVLTVHSISATVSGDGLNINNFSGDGSDTTFTLSAAPKHENNTQVYIDGVYQFKNTYAVDGTTLTFSAAPPNGTAIEVMTHSQTNINTFPATGISGLTQVTAAGADHFMIFDATDNALKKALVSDVLDNVVLTDEQAQDIVGAMFSSNTETGITATYQDADGTVDLVLDAAQPTVTSLGTLTTLTVDDITINGSTITDSGDLTLDIGGDLLIDVDGAEIKLSDNGNQFGTLSVVNDNFCVTGSDADHAGLIMATHAILPAEAGAEASANVIDLGANGNEFKTLYLDTSIIASNALSIATGTDLTIDAEGVIKLDANGAEIQIKDGGTEIGAISMGSQNINIESKQADKDIVFKGIDGSSDVTALTLDMSDGGSAHFNHDMYLNAADAFLHVGASAGSYAHQYADNLVLRANDGGMGITLATDTDDDCNIHFSDATSGVGQYAGYITYSHSLNAFKFGTSSVERMRILSDGEIIQGTASLADTYSPLVNGWTGDALVVGRHASSGSLGLWRTNTMEFKYYHNGGGYIMTFGSNSVISGDFNDTSDVNLKQNISTIADGTTVINSLRPVKFDWKASEKGNNQHGFIAQEVETVLPDAVEGNDYVENETGLPEDEPEGNGKTMNSNAVLAHAVKAIQELEARIKVLEG